MKKGLCIFLLVLTNIYSPLLMNAQQSAKSPDTRRLTQDENMDDPYLPNAYNNKRVSPAYKYVSPDFDRRIKGKLRTSSAGTSIFTIQVNVDVNNQNILLDAANEPNIVVNLADPNKIAIGWRQFDNVLSNFRQAGYSYSADGGQTWTAGVIEPGIFRSDPVLDYDNAGNFFYNSLSSSGVNLFPCTVFKSTNGGALWNLGTAAGGGDKQWMAIDRTTGPGSGNIYSAWTSFYSYCPPGNFTRSTNGAVSFDSCEFINGDPRLGTETVGNFGDYYVAGASPLYPDSVVVCKSVDAQTPGSMASWNPPVNISLDGDMHVGSFINPEGLVGQINIDVDRSAGAGGEIVYVLATLPRISVADPSDVMFVRSNSSQTMWSNPVRINDDSDTTHSQWLGTLSVAPNGRIDVVWLDTRDDPGGDFSALYYSYSTDQGTTWSANEKLSDSFDPHAGYPNQRKMGDYFDMISDNTGAHLAWANTLNGEEDVYYSYIIPPLNSGIENSLNANGISLYPNPATESFSINGISTHVKIEMFDMIGGKILETYTDKFSTEINIASVAKGIYIIKISNEIGSSILKKIIKE